MNNIILIGMPGAGKSTIGILLAKRLLMGFVDTDVLIQQRQETGLQEIMDRDGYLALRHLEEQEILALTVNDMVIATGGSAAYSPQAMRHLHASGTILYLQADVNVLLSRINDMSSRGIAKAQNQSFEDLYKEREALYRAHADIEIACGVMNHGQVLEVIVAMLKKNNVK